MFQSSTIIREPALNLTKLIFMLKHSVKLGQFAEYFNTNMTLAMNSAGSLMMVEGRNI